MDTIKLNPHHLTDINAKSVVYSGGVNNYGAVQTDVDTVVCIAPYAMKMVSFTIRADTLESAGGSIDVRKAASGTELSAATDMAMQVLPTSIVLTAATNYDMSIASGANGTVAAGDLVALMVGDTGELTGLAWLAVFERV